MDGPPDRRCFFLSYRDNQAKTIENIRPRFVERGLEDALNRKKSPTAGAKQLLTGDEEAKVVATRLGPSPQGHGKWTLRLLVRKVVELQNRHSIQPPRVNGRL